MDIYAEARLLTEEPIGTLLRKQDSITSLFPPFYDRVKAVGKAGGISLYEEDPGLWHFKVASATTPGLKYDIHVEFRDIVNQLETKLQDMRLWNKEKTAVDLKKVAGEIMDDADLKISCSCPAFRFWGPAYITTQRKSKYGDKENRPPNVRNPKKYGVACKHAQLMFDVLPFYKGTLAGHLKRYFKKEIAAAEAKAKETQAGVQKATAALKQKEPPPKPPVKAAPKTAPKPPIKPEPKGPEQEAPSESVLEAQHSRSKCMECGKPPTKEVKWAEGMAHAWFCEDHFKSWSAEHGGDIDAMKEVKDGEASKKFADNPNPNTWKQPSESVKISEAYEQYEYIPSTDKKELMLDFYLINALPTAEYDEVMKELRDPGADASAQRGGPAFNAELQYALHDVKDTLYSYLQEHMLEAVFFAICCEFRHIFDTNKAEKIVGWAKNQGSKTERFMKKYGADFTLRSGHKGAYLRKPELKVSHTEDSETRQWSYQAINNAMKQTGMKEADFVDIAEAAFGGGELSWAGAYGGKPWANICDGWQKLKNSPKEQLSIWIDHIYDLQHNTDTVFNKLQSYYKESEGWSWIKRALDFKFKSTNVYQFFDKVSPDLKNFAAAVIKDMSGTDFESWAKQQAAADVTKAKADMAKAAQAPLPKGIKKGDTFSVKGGDGVTKQFIAGVTKVIYKAGSKKDKIGQTALVLGPGGSPSYAQIKFDKDGVVWSANVKNLDIVGVVTPPKADKTKGKYFVGMKGLYTKIAGLDAGKKLPVEIGEIEGNKIFVWSNNVALHGSVGSLDPKSKGYSYSWVTDVGELEKQFAPDPGQEAPKMEKPNAIGGFALGDLVKYTGTKTQKLVGDVGQIMNFNKTNLTIAGIKWQKLGKLVWVSINNLAEAEPGSPEGASGFKVGDKVEYTGDQHNDPYYNQGDTGTITQLYPDTNAALVQWDGGTQIGVALSELKRIHGTAFDNTLKKTLTGVPAEGKDILKVGDKVKYIGKQTMKFIGQTGTVIKMGFGGSGDFGPKVKIEFDNGYKGTAFVKNLEKI